MMIFWLILGVMTVLGILMLLPALRGKNSVHSDEKAIGNREQNIAIARERMDELKNELDEGTLSQQAYQQTLDELEKGLLIDVAAADSDVEVRDVQSSSKSGLILVLVAVPLLSFGLYHYLGSPQYLDVAGPGKPATALASNVKPGEVPSMDEMIAGLLKKTSDKPGDPNAWYLLGRLYAATDAFEKSVEAYEQLVKVSDRQPTALVVLADSLAMIQEGKLEGRPIALINEALEKDPSHTTALWMAGQSAADNQQYAESIDYWQRAYVGLKDNVEMQAELKRMINEAVVLAKDAGQEVAELNLPDADVAVSITMQISLDPSLQSQLKAGDILFIFAKAVSGPPMPLAAIKRNASEMPVQIILDNSSLLRPGTSLLDYPQLKITARVSHDGQAIAQSGDLQSQPVIVETVGNPAITLIIDQRLP